LSIIIPVGLGERAYEVVIGHGLIDDAAVRWKRTASPSTPSSFSREKRPRVSMVSPIYATDCSNSNWSEAI
jgi:hypothetical protein